MGMLGDKEIQHAEIRDKQYRLRDGDGLTVLVRPNGAKLWQLRYRFDGKEKTLSLGEYPTRTLRSAREKAQDARRLLLDGIDPMQIKAEAKVAKAQQEAQGKYDAATRFEIVAREWFEKFRKANDWSPNHAGKIIGRLERDIFPWLGQRPIGEIKALELLEALRRIEARGALETAHRTLSDCGRVFSYAVASGLAERNPSADLRGALPPYKKDKHFAAVTDVKNVADLLRDIQSYSGTLVVRTAFALSPLLFLRPGEIRQMQWSWIDFDDALITVPPHSHKTGKRTQEPHLVPLSSQAIALLREIRPLTGNDKYVFPGARDKNRAMSDNAVRSAMRRLGWTGDEMTPHGFRAMSSTILDNMGYRQEWIERQLAHDEPNKVKAAYKREMHAMYLPERRKMMQEWSDYLDSLRDGAQIIPFRTA